MKHPIHKKWIACLLFLLAASAILALAIPLYNQTQHTKKLETTLAVNQAKLDKTYRIMLERSRERINMEKRLKDLELEASVRPQYLFDTPPVFIFRSVDVPWSHFLPYLPENLGNLADIMQGEHAITGSFAIPPNGDMAGISGITWDRKHIHFPKTGEYYLYSTLGSFKILVLPPTPSDKDILDIARFVARNIVHTSAGHARPPVYTSQATPAWVGQFFLSDQPLLLWCGAGSSVLNYILNRVGYKTRFMQVKGMDTQGHQFSEAYFPDAKKWGLIDQDYGAAFRNPKTGKPLDTTEVARGLSLTPENVEAYFFVHKKHLLASFNQQPYQPIFTWTPDKMDGFHPNSAEEYKNLMSDFTSVYFNTVYETDPTSPQMGLP